ncbi:MAG: SpoIID/LytB domain-containing protein [Nitrospinae bacterium]|nr:SpoIID/LytB domain-containing protein [Nitrospinota bacterium]
MVIMIKGLKSKLYIIFCLFIFFSGTSEGANIVRVAIKTSPNIKLETAEGARIFDAAYNRSFIIKSQQMTVTPSNPGITINNSEFGSAVKIITPADTLIKVDKNNYRGSIEIRRGERDSLLVINEIDIEDYLKGVINEEISAKWHHESLKAQAVVARTYALYQKERRKDNPYHLEATTADQVYGGARNEDERTNRAVEDTRGIVLTYDGRLAKAFYHSASGGITEDVTDVWGGEGESYLKPVKCDFDRDAPNYQWEVEMDKAHIETAFSRNGIRTDDISSIEIISFTSSKRVSELYITHRNGVEKISGVDFRRIIGYDTIKSTLFRVKENGGGFLFYGRGSGHGVGLCQWGAKGMAEKGYSFTDILKYYYPGIEIKRMK